MLLALPCGAAAAWRPDVEVARAYAKHRPGVASFSIREGARGWGWRGSRTVPAASLMKTIFLAAYLRRAANRPLRRSDRALLAPMIRRSDNVTATRIRDLVGVGALRAIARRAGMTDFRPAPVWGLSRTSARDQARLFARLERVLPARHRLYALRLLAGVVPAQRWGVARAAPGGWRLHFKGGWGSGTGAVDHQAALLVRGERRVALAITTTGNGAHAAGKETLRGIAARLLRNLG